MPRARCCLQAVLLVRLTKSDVLSQSDTAYLLLKSNPTERELQLSISIKAYAKSFPGRIFSEPSLTQQEPRASRSPTVVLLFSAAQAKPRIAIR